MRILYHYPLCPYSRKIRLLLSEKKLDFSLKREDFWQKRPDFLSVNHYGRLPVFLDLNGSSIVEHYAISEYLEEAYPERQFIGQTIKEKAEIRRIMHSIDDLFYREVTEIILFEKHYKRFFNQTGPDSQIIRKAKSDFSKHALYFTNIIDKRNWLAGNNFSLADITAASHISVVDYFGDISWDNFKQLKEWYVRIKSRPTFRSFFLDRAHGTVPATNYAELDF